MYCPVCGEEIIIVSDFEIKLEDNIDVAALAKTAEIPDLSGIASKRDITKELNKPEKDVPVRKKPAKSVPEEKAKPVDKKWLILLAILGAVFVTGCVIGGVSISRYYSYDHQFEKASKEFEAGDFKQAIKTGKHLNTLGNDEKGKILLADSYIADHNYDAAIAVLYDALNDYPQDVHATATASIQTC